MSRRRVYPAGYRNMDISSKAYGTGTVKLLASGFSRWLNFAGFAWDGQHRDNQNRPLLLELTDPIMLSDGSSFYPSTILVPNSSGVLNPSASVAIEGNDVKLTAHSRTDSLYVGLFYFGTQFV